MYDSDSFSYGYWLKTSAKSIPDLKVFSSRKSSGTGLEVALLQSNNNQVLIPAFSSYLIVIYLEHINSFVGKIDRQVHKAEVRPGLISIIPSGVSSEWQWKKKQGDGGCLHLALDAALVHQIADKNEYIYTSQIEILPQFLVQDLQIQHIGLALKALLEEDFCSDNLFIESLTTALVARVLKKFSALKQQACEPQGGLSRQKLSLVIDYINNNLDKDVKLIDLAALLGISPSHLTRLFKQSMGVTPYQYVVQCRIRQAKLLLQQGGLTISDVATLVNFHDQSHLTHHFKRILGVTPKQFLQR